MDEWGRVVVMLPIAMAASLGMVYVMLGKGWMQKGRRYWWVARIGAGSAAYVLMSYAYPLWEPNQVVSAVALVGYWCVYVGVVWWLASWVDGRETGPKVGEAMQSEVMFDLEGDNGDETDNDGWVVVPFDSGAGGGLHGSQAGRNQDSRGASTDGYGEIRLPVSGGEGASGSTGSASPGSSSGGKGGGFGGSGAGEQPNVYRQGAGKDGEGNGMAPGSSVPSANRGGRGRRLSGAVVQG